jgi:hypothetical protein
MKQMVAFVAVSTGQFLAGNERHVQRDYRGAFAAAPIAAAVATLPGNSTRLGNLFEGRVSLLIDAESPARDDFLIGEQTRPVLSFA